MTVEIDATTELDRIAERIDALVSVATHGGRPYYISALGMDLGTDLKTVKELTKGTLADFVRSRLNETHEVAGLGKFGNVLAIIPVGGEIPQPAEKVADEFERDSQGRPRYHYRLWAAFSVPVRDGMERHIHLDDLTFDDVPEGGDVPPGTLEISPQLIPPEDVPRRDDVIWDSLNRWLAEHNLAPEQFYARPRRAARLARQQSRLAFFFSESGGDSHRG